MIPNDIVKACAEATLLETSFYCQLLMSEAPRASTHLLRTLRPN